MTCPNCGKANPEGTNFCVSCGTKLEAAPAAEMSPAADLNAEPLTTPTAPTAPAGQKKPINKGLIIKIAVAVAVVLVAILVIVGIKSCGGKKIDFAKMPIRYATDGDVFILKSGDKTGKTLADYDDWAGNAKLSMDGKTIFFGLDPDGDEFDLYYRDTSKKDESANTKIESGISWYLPTPDGKNIFYIKNEKLYKANLKNKKTELGKDVSSVLEVAPDMNGVIYRSYDDDETTIIYSNGKYKIELSDVSNAHAYFSENGKKILVVEPEEKPEMKSSDEFDTLDEYYEYQDEYYATPDTQKLLVCEVGNNKKPEKLADGVCEYDYTFLDDNFSKLYYINEDKELVYKNGNKSEETVIDDAEYLYRIGEDKVEEILVETAKEGEEKTTYSLFYVDGTKTTELLGGEDGIGCEDYTTGKIFYSYEYEYDEETYESNYEYTYYVRNKNKLNEVDLPEDCDTYFDSDNSVLYTIEDIDEEDGTGTLKRYEVKKDKLGKAEEIADDVSDIQSLSNFCDKETLLVYTGTKGDELSVYNGKKLVEVSSDFHSIEWVHKDGTLVIKEDYNGTEGTSTISKFDGKKTVEIADDVRSVVVLDKNLIYFTNEDYELYKSTGKAGKEKLVDDDECSISHPFYMIEYLDNYYDSDELTDMIDARPYN